MPRVCTICTHPDRDALDAALVSGEALRGIARRFAVSEDALFRHRPDHISAALAKAKDAAEVVHADTLLDRMRTLNAETAFIMTTAKRTLDLETMLKAIGRAEKQLELEARLLGELQEGQTVINLLLAPEFVAAQTVILRALAPFPAARVAVAEALAALGTGG